MRRFLVAVAVLAVGLAADSPPSSDAQFLKDHGVAPDAAGLLKYLQALQDRKDALESVRQLGSDDFDQRETATRSLMRVGLTVLPELQKAAEGTDPEARRRAGEILAHIESETKPILFAALRVVQEQRPAGAAPELLKLLPTFPAGYLQRSLRDAAWASARPEDAKEIRAALADASIDVRAAALVALEKAIGADADDEVRKRLDDPEEVVRLAALRALTPRAPRECLDGYVALLEAKNPRVRAESAAVLRGLTGQRLGAGGDSEDGRKKAAAEWKAWVKDNGKTATMHLPVHEKAATRDRILVCVLRPNSIKELDAEGKVVFTSADLGACCGCQGLEDGSRVFADWDNHAVVELDAKGKVAWKKDLPDTPNCLHRLDDGGTLVGLFNKKEIWEIKKDGSVPWKATVDGQPTDARRLDNGRTLVALFGTNRVVELSPEGKVVWTIDDVASPESARRLDNGDTLVASSRTGQVLQYSPAGKVVWSAKDAPSASDAVELENGNVLIGYERGLREVSRDGKVVREIAVGVVRRISCD